MIAPGIIYAGSQVSLPIHIENDTGSDIDPATITATTLTPGGLKTTYTYGSSAELTKSSVGDYVLTIIATMPGRWQYRWLTTGTSTVVAVEGAFNVRASAFVDDAFALRDYA